MQQIYARVPDAASIVHFSKETRKLEQPLDKLPRWSASSVVWSSDGDLLALIAPQGVTIRQGEKLEQVAHLDLSSVLAVAFSPRSTYLTTYQRPHPGAGNAEKNLKVWEWRAKKVAMQLFQKSYSKDTWPAISFTGDESSALHLVTNAVNVYDPADFASGVQKKLGLKNIGGFAVSQNAGAVQVAAYVPEGKGSPGFVGVWPLAQLSKHETPPPTARRSFFRATYAKLTWNAPGTGMLALTATDTDATNQSYYGEQKLSFLSADGTNDCMVQLKEGPVHDVQWSPAGDFFIAVAGFMPAKTTLFSATCKPVCELGSGPHNLIRWSPQRWGGQDPDDARHSYQLNHGYTVKEGRFFALAGFGNLPGDMVFYDRKNDGRCKQMGAVRAENGVTCDWSPDGRYLLTATIAPRLRVDNGLQIYRYTGEKLLDERIEVLLEAAWRPAPEGAFPDLPQSPRSNGSAAPPTQPQRAAGYMAPHLRGTGASSSGNFSLAHDADDLRGKIGLNLHKQRLVPGAAPPESKTASKNTKKRNRNKNKAAGEGDGEEAQLGVQEADSAPVEGVQSGMAQMSVAGTEQSEGQDGAADDAKRLRNLQKKLRQVQQLKERQAKGESLEPEQIAKIGGETGLLAEIQSLGG